MNWDAVGAIGEVVGALAVVATLGYLAIQIRQNTMAVRRNSVRQANEGNSRALNSLIDEGVSEVFVRGLKSLDDLSDVERFRFDNVFYQWLSAQEQAFIDRREGAISDDSFAVYENTVPGFLTTPGGREWWRQRCLWFSSSFRNDVDRLISMPTVEAKKSGPVL